MQHRPRARELEVRPGYTHTDRIYRQNSPCDIEETLQKNNNIMAPRLRIPTGTVWLRLSIPLQRKCVGYTGLLCICVYLKRTNTNARFEKKPRTASPSLRWHRFRYQLDTHRRRRRLQTDTRTAPQSPLWLESCRNCADARSPAERNST